MSALAEAVRAVVDDFDWQAIERAEADAAGGGFVSVEADLALIRALRAALAEHERQDALDRAVLEAEERFERAWTVLDNASQAKTAPPLLARGNFADAVGALIAAVRARRSGG